MAAILISGLSVVTTSCSNEDTLVHVTTSVSGTWISVEGYLKMHPLGTFALPDTIKCRLERLIRVYIRIAL